MADVDDIAAIDTIDDNHLSHLGYEQEMTRKVTFLGSVGIALGCIQPLLCAGVFYFGFGFGGPVEITWGFLGVFAWSAFLALSMAEISSQYTVAGGPYYWAGALSGRLGKLPSYVSGWMLFLNILGGIVSYEYQSAQQILAMRLIYTNGYDYKTPPGILGSTKGVSFGVPLPNVTNMPFQKAMFGIMAGLAVFHAITSFMPVKYMNTLALCSFAWLVMITSVMCFALPAVTSKRNDGKFIFGEWIPSSQDFNSPDVMAPTPAMAPGPADAAVANMTSALLGSNGTLSLLNGTYAGYVTTAAGIAIATNGTGHLPANLTIQSMYGPLAPANVGLVTKLPTEAWNGMVGLLMAQYLMTYYDVPSHMAEETRNAAWTVPRSIMFSFVLAGFTNFGMLVSFVACLNLDNYQYDFLFGTPLQHKDDRIASGNFLFGGVTNGLFPVGNIFYDSFMARYGSPAGAIALTAFIFIGTQFAAVMNFTSFSRFLFSFARDGGLPFSTFFAKIEPNTQVPINALILALVCVIALSTPMLSDNWFQKINAMTGFVNGMLYTWMVPPLLRIVNRHLFKPHVKFNLGRASIPCAAMGAAYCAFCLGTIALPNTLPATKLNLNYAPIILGAVLLYALLSYPFVGPLGMNLYRGPATAPDDLGESMLGFKVKNFPDFPAAAEPAVTEDSAKK